MTGLRHRGPWIALLLLAPLAIWGVTRRQGPPTFEIERADLDVTVEVTGTLEATQAELLGPPQLDGVWQFKISMMAPEGQQVPRGAPVLGFDTSELQRELVEKRQEHKTALQQLEKRRSELRISHLEDELRLAEASARLEKAYLSADQPAGIVSKNEAQRARLELQQAELEVEFLERKMPAAERAAMAEIEALGDTAERAERRTGELERALTQMTLAAPRDGTVIYVSERGEKKKVGDTCWRRDKVLQIPDLTKLRAEGEVDEVDAGALVAGQSLTLRLDAHPDHEYEATIAAVSRTVQAKSRRDPRKVVRLDLALAHTDPERMRPGMRFRGQVVIDPGHRALVVPLSVVTLEGDRAVVERRRWLGYSTVELVLGRRSGELIEVLSGLAEGDVVRRRPRSGSEIS